MYVTGSLLEDIGLSFPFPVYRTRLQLSPVQVHHGAAWRGFVSQLQFVPKSVHFVIPKWRLFQMLHQSLRTLTINLIIIIQYL